MFLLYWHTDLEANYIFFLTCHSRKPWPAVAAVVGQDSQLHISSASILLNVSVRCLTYMFGREQFDLNAAMMSQDVIIILGSTMTWDGGQERNSRLII
jgi:hypothetical protein